MLILSPALRWHWDACCRRWNPRIGNLQMSEGPLMSRAEEALRHGGFQAGCRARVPLEGSDLIGLGARGTWQGQIPPERLRVLSQPSTALAFGLGLGCARLGDGS